MRGDYNAVDEIIPAVYSSNSSSSEFHSYISVVHHFGWDFRVWDHDDLSIQPLRKSYSVFVDGAYRMWGGLAGIHSSRTWMSRSIESVRWNACRHRLDLGLYSHLKEFWGNGVRTHINSEEIPSTRKIFLRGGSNPWRCIKQQWAQHTTNELF